MRGDSSCVHYQARIHLLFVVETRFETYYLQIDNSGTCVLYVDLQAPSVERNLEDDADFQYDVAI